MVILFLGAACSFFFPLGHVRFEQLLGLLVEVGEPAADQAVARCLGRERRQHLRSRCDDAVGDGRCLAHKGQEGLDACEAVGVLLALA